jgi:Tfp pilus assembly protein PilN
MAITSEQVIALAQHTKALSSGQLEQLLMLIPHLDDTQLQKLQNHLLDIQTATLKDAKNHLAMLNEVLSLYKEFKTTESREVREEAEAKSDVQDEAAAEELLKDL